MAQMRVENGPESQNPGGGEATRGDELSSFERETDIVDFYKQQERQTANLKFMYFNLQKEMTRSQVDVNCFLN